MFKKARIVFLALLGVGIIVVLVAGSCMTARTSDKKVKTFFAEHLTPVSLHRIPYLSDSIRYLVTGTNPKNVVVFIHGAPGSSDAFHKYLSDKELTSKATLVSIDRPGYGYSAYGKSMPGIIDQARAMWAVIDQFPDAQNLVTVGHSYGGPIAARLAMEQPDRVDAAIMLAPLNDPPSEPIFWFSYFGKWKATRWMLSKALRVAGDEKFAHADALREIESDWKDLQVPIVHIHGMKDKLAPPKPNIDFSRKHIPDSLLTMTVIEKTNHFIPWSDYDLVKKTILGALSH